MCSMVLSQLAQQFSANMNLNILYFGRVDAYQIPFFGKNRPYKVFAKLKRTLNFKIVRSRYTKLIENCRTITF